MTRHRMLRRMTGLAMAGIAMCVLTLTVVPAAAQPGGGGQRPNFDITQMMYPEITWAAVAFEAKASDKQIASLRPTFQKVQDARVAARKKARENRDFSAMQKVAKSGKASIDAKMKAVLGASQLAKVKNWVSYVQAKAKAMASQGPSGRRMRMGLGGLMYIESTWSRVAFVAKASSSQLTKLKPTFAAGWAARKKALKLTDPKERGEAIGKIMKSIQTKLKSVLTDEQMAKLRPPRGRGMGPGGPGGGRGPGGGGRGPGGAR